MNKETIEISRDKHITGYGKFFYLNEKSPEILNRLIDWSEEYINRGKFRYMRPKPKIYIHKVRYVEEVNNKLGKYFMDGGLKQYGEQLGPSMEIPYCDLVCYLDIYYQ